MYSQYWSATAGPDYRRYTVVEGDAPLPLGSTCRRKRLHSAGEDDEREAGRSGVSRCYREPEEAREETWEEEQEETWEEEQEALQRLCQRCHIMASQLNRQAAALAGSTALKDPAYASFLLRKLQWPRGSRRASADARCHICSASFHQLRRRALHRALRVSGDLTPAAAMAANKPSSAPPCLGPPSEGGERGGAPWAWGGVQSVYLGGGGAKGLATVTPLPLNAHSHLEGVWRVSCCSQQDSPAGGHMTAAAVSCDRVRPACHSIATQTSQPPSAAAGFFIRAAQKLSLSRRKRPPPGPLSPRAGTPGPPLLYGGGFSGALQLSPPPVPACLLRDGSKMKDGPGRGKVRVMVRVSAVAGGNSAESVSVLKVDSRKKQLTLCRTSGSSSRASSSCASSSSSSEAHRRSAVLVPETFTFDAVFCQDASQAEVCVAALAEVVLSVVNGADGCIFCYGHANSGKTYTMIGRECSTQSLGVAPTAVSWLFKVMEERRQKSGTLFSVDVSAVEVSGQEEQLTDLLAGLASSTGGQQGAQGPAVTLQEDALCGSQLLNQTELFASSAERAAFFLDAAVASRRSSRTPSDQAARRNSHFLFTLHLHQERAEKSSKASVSGRSRLHLLDLGSCETDISRTREGGGARCLSLSALGNVLLALTSGAKHVPYRDSKLAMLLGESLANINCRTAMIAHVCASPSSFLETLTTLQLAARVHRAGNRKSKPPPGSSGRDSWCDEAPPTHLPPLHSGTTALDPDIPLQPRRDPDCSSSSEHSYDAVVYVGAGLVPVSERELSGGEAPPFFIPIIPSLNRKQAKATPKSDSNQFKCNTFAELQERLDCINGVEGSGGGAKGAEEKTADRTSLQRISEENRDQEPLRFLPAGVPSGETVREKVLLQGGALNCSASPPWTPSPPQTAPSEVPAAATSPRARREVLDAPPTECSGTASSAPEPVGRRAAVTLQRQVELSEEDELWFTLMEELPCSSVPGNGRPPRLLSLSCSAGASDRQPVSIISSINDEYDAYTLPRGAADPGAEADASRHPRMPPCHSEGRPEHRAALGGGSSSHSSVQPPCQLVVKSCLPDRGVCLSEPRIQPSPPNTPSLTKSPPGAPHQGSPKSSTTSGPTPHHRASLPRTAKPPSAAQVSQSAGRPPKSGHTADVSSETSGGGGSTVLRSSRAQTSSSSGGCRRETLIKLPPLIRGAATLGTGSAPPSSASTGRHDGASLSGVLRFSSLGKKKGPKNNKTRSGNASPLTPPVRPLSQDRKTRTGTSPGAFETGGGMGNLSKPPVSEAGSTKRLRTDSCSHRSLKMSSSLKTRGAKVDSSHGSLKSPEQRGAQPSPRPKQEVLRLGGAAASGGGGRFSRSLSRLGPPASAAASPTRSALGPPERKAERLQAERLQAERLQAERLQAERLQAGGGGSSSLAAAAPAGPALPPGSPRPSPLPSPYSKVTAPRRPQRHSSDNSSVLSGELPPAMGRTALLYRSGGSSGYGSMIRDGETTGSNSSAQDSTSDSGVSSANRSRVSKSPRKRGSGFLRRRLIPAPLPDACTLGRKAGSQWADVPPPGGSKEPFEIKVYEIDDVERLQRRREEAGSQPIQEVEEGLLYFSRRLRMLQKREQQIQEQRSKQERLKEELEETRSLLMLPASRWSHKFHLDQDLDRDSQEYLEALAQVTAELEDCVNLCKSHVMMETCFDITATTRGQQGVEV